MMKKLAALYAKTGMMMLIFVLFILLVKTVDVQAIGPMGSQVGFATVNGAVFQFLGEGPFWDGLTNLLMVASFLVVAFFGGMGLYQWIKGKSLKKVDMSLFVLAGFYVLMVIFFLIFEVFPVNFRPVLEEGELEASFPSTHTFVVLCVIFSAVTMAERFWVNKKTQLGAVYVTAALICVLMVIGRVASGEHWLTDVIGGVLLASTLLCAFRATLSLLCPEA